MSEAWTRAILRTVILAAVVAAINITLAWTGRYTIVWLSAVLVLGAEVVGFVLILRATARRGFGFLRQLAVGSVAVVLLALLLFPATVFALTVAAPDYGEVLSAMQRADMEEQGVPAEEIEEALARFRDTNTPVRQGYYTMIGTAITCAPIVLVISIFVRARDGRVRDDVEPS